MRGSEGVECNTLICLYKFDRYGWSSALPFDGWALLLLSLLAIGNNSFARLRAITWLVGRVGWEGWFVDTSVSGSLGESGSFVVACFGVSDSTRVVASGVLEGTITMVGGDGGFGGFGGGISGFGTGRGTIGVVGGLGNNGTSTVGRMDFVDPAVMR